MGTAVMTGLVGASALCFPPLGCVPGAAAAKSAAAPASGGRQTRAALAQSLHSALAHTLLLDTLSEGVY